MSTKSKEKHIITQTDLDKNPDLASEGVKVGDEVELSGVVDSHKVIENLEKEIDSKTLENESLVSQLKAKDDEIESLKAELANAQKEKTDAEFVNTDGKVIVHFGVNINGKDYKVADILKDKDIQKYLLEIESGAIEKVTKG